MLIAQGVSAPHQLYWGNPAFLSAQTQRRAFDKSYPNQSGVQSSRKGHRALKMEKLSENKPQDAHPQVSADFEVVGTARQTRGSCCRSIHSGLQQEDQSHTGCPSGVCNCPQQTSTHPNRLVLQEPNREFLDALRVC